MKQEYTIELVEEYDNVNFYSIHLEGEELTEMEAFFENFPVGCEYDDEIDVIISWIDKIAEKGALERYFRPEGHYGDGVGVMDNLVHDGVVNGAVLVGVGINAFIPSVSYWVQKTVALCLVWASMISSRTKAY